MAKNNTATPAPVVDESPELKDLVNGDLESIKAPETGSPATQDPEVAPTRSFADRTAKVAGQLTPEAELSAQVIIRTNIENYVAVMAPGKPVTEKDGAFQQLRLWRTIEQVLNAKPEYFHAVMNTLLSEINDHRKTVFNEKYAFRFFHRVELPSETLKSFERLVNLFINTADPRGRGQALKQVDMEKTLEKIPSEEVRQRIYSFYYNR